MSAPVAASDQCVSFVAPWGTRCDRTDTSPQVIGCIHEHVRVVPQCPPHAADPGGCRVCWEHPEYPHLCSLAKPPALAAAS